MLIPCKSGNQLRKRVRCFWHEATASMAPQNLLKIEPYLTYHRVVAAGSRQQAAGSMPVAAGNTQHGDASQQAIHKRVPCSIHKWVESARQGGGVTRWRYIVVFEVD